MIPRHWKRARRRARRQRVALRALWTLAHRQVAFRVANGAGTALANARIHARVIDARPMVTAFAVRLTFAAHAMAERISGVAGEAGAHGTLLVGVVVARLALGVGAARIRRAEILCARAIRLFINNHAK